MGETYRAEVPEGSAYRWLMGLGAKYELDLPEGMITELIACLKDPRPITREERIRHYRDDLKRLSDAQAAGDEERVDLLMRDLDRMWLEMSEDEADEVRFAGLAHRVKQNG